MQYSSPNTRGGQLNEEVHYENAELYENMPSSKLDICYPPKLSSSSSSSASHYKSPVSKVSSKFLAADTKTKATAQVTNTLLITVVMFYSFNNDLPLFLRL